MHRHKTARHGMNQLIIRLQAVVLCGRALFVNKVKLKCQFLHDFNQSSNLNKFFLALNIFECNMSDEKRDTDRFKDHPMKDVPSYKRTWPSCKHCDERFPSDFLKVHIQTNHPEEARSSSSSSSSGSSHPEPDQTCPICHENFTAPELQVHIEWVHFDELSDHEPEGEGEGEAEESTPATPASSPSPSTSAATPPASSSRKRSMPVTIRFRRDTAEKDSDDKDEAEAATEAEAEGEEEDAEGQPSVKKARRERFKPYKVNV